MMLEEDASDRELSQAYFKEYGLSAHFLGKSNEVIPYLAPMKPSQRPSVILLSMKAVPDTGLEILKKLKADPELKQIPVVMLGENTLPDRIAACYEAGANTFINKPFSDKLTDRKIRIFLSYWFEVAETAGKDQAAYLVR